MIGLSILQVVLTFAGSPLLDGFVRKYIKAKLAHSRVGPLTGPWQTYIDLIKLLGKEDLIIEGAPYLPQILIPLAALGSVLVGSLLVPISGVAPLGQGGDMIVFIYCMGAGIVSVILAALSAGSPYAHAGAIREVCLHLIVEPVLFVALLSAVVLSQSLRFEDQLMWHLSQGFSLPMLIGAVALFAALQAQFGKLPFDIPEAEQEIVGGLFTEMSGPRLALFRLFFLSRQFVFACLLCTVFLPWGLTDIPILNLLTTVVKVFVVYCLIGLLDALLPRLRIDQALRFYLTVLLTAAVGAVLAYLAA